MDMKRILQAMDGASSKPVEGANSMAKFLSIVDKNANVQILQEGKSPHKVTLPVQMAMQHYQQKEEKPLARVGRTSVVGKYFHDVEQEFEEQQTNKRQLINQYASTIAERVMMKESIQKDPIEQIAKRKVLQSLDSSLYKNHKKKKNVKTFAENEIPDHSMGFTGGAGPGIMPNEEVTETPIDFNKDDPMGSEIHSHQGVNPASIRTRMMRASRQMAELAEMAKSDDPRIWQHLANLFPELAMNIEQVKHGIEQLAEIKSKGGRRSANIPSGLDKPNPIKEANAKKKTLKNSNPCWKDYHPVGTKKKGGRTVPNCVPNE